MTNDAQIIVKSREYCYAGKPPIMEVIWMLGKAYEFWKTTKKIIEKLRLESAIFQQEIISIFNKTSPESLLLLTLPSMDFKDNDLDFWYRQVCAETKNLIRRYASEKHGVETFRFGRRGLTKIKDELISLKILSKEDPMPILIFKHVDFSLEGVEVP